MDRTGDNFLSRRGTQPDSEGARLVRVKTSPAHLGYRRWTDRLLLSVDFACGGDRARRTIIRTFACGLPSSSTSRDDHSSLCSAFFNARSRIRGLLTSSQRHCFGPAAPACFEVSKATSGAFSRCACQSVCASASRPRARRCRRRTRGVRCPACPGPRSLRACRECGSA